MNFKNQTRELYVNGDSLGTITDIEFKYDTLVVTTDVDEELGFETKLVFFASFIKDMRIDELRLALIVENPLKRKL